MFNFHADSFFFYVGLFFYVIVVYVQSMRKKGVIWKHAIPVCFLFGIVTFITMLLIGAGMAWGARPLSTTNVQPLDFAALVPCPGMFAILASFGLAIYVWAEHIRYLASTEKKHRQDN